MQIKGIHVVAAMALACLASVAAYHAGKRSARDFCILEATADNIFTYVLLHNELDNHDYEKMRSQLGLMLNAELQTYDELATEPNPAYERRLLAGRRIAQQATSNFVNLGSILREAENFQTQSNDDKPSTPSK